MPRRGKCARSPPRRLGFQRYPNVAAIFENLEAGSDIEEIIEQFHVTREQVQAVLEFATRSLDAPPPVPVGASASPDANCQYAE